MNKKILFLLLLLLPLASAQFGFENTNLPELKSPPKTLTVTVSSSNSSNNITGDTIWINQSVDSGGFIKIRNEFPQTILINTTIDQGNITFYDENNPSANTFIYMRTAGFLELDGLGMRFNSHNVRYGTASGTDIVWSTLTSANSSSFTWRGAQNLWHFGRPINTTNFTWSDTSSGLRLNLTNLSVQNINDYFDGFCQTGNVSNGVYANGSFSCVNDNSGAGTGSNFLTNQTNNNLNTTANVTFATVQAGNLCYSNGTNCAASSGGSSAILVNTTLGLQINQSYTDAIYFNKTVNKVWDQAPIQPTLLWLANKSGAFRTGSFTAGRLNNTNIGYSSFGSGNCVASGLRSFCAGTGTSNNTNTVSFGSANVQGIRSFGGGSCSVTGGDAFCVGSGTANQDLAISIGDTCYSEGASGSICIGVDSNSSGTSSIALGRGTNVYGSSSIAINPNYQFTEDTRYFLGLSNYFGIGGKTIINTNVSTSNTILEVNGDTSVSKKYFVYTNASRNYTCVLASGTCKIPNDLVTGKTVITCMRQGTTTSITNIGTLAVVGINSGNHFNISSSNLLEADTIGCIFMEPYS